ncbi:hypothetical protein BP6252_05960 [Coleophoma cylindrospora]|uniref:Uncharacterized protein n=1 Tax=Coleophoma cylindrospora TaxID=1849047 RepID=A0A3D8RLH9_9HELO|nr:hypothetical protein BP6252_05960 [Coleophoma cylindrospora]
MDETFIRRALKHADINALRLALIQVTHEKELEQMPVSQVENFGGAVTDYVLSDVDQKRVCDKAVEYLLQERHEIPPPPPREEAYRLMDLYSNIPMSSPLREVGFDYEEAYEQLAYDDFPRDVKWTKGPPDSFKNWKVIIVGAGFSGIAAAIMLQRLGIPFEVVERQGGVGGTWLLNRYPNVRVDSLSFLYQYRFTKDYKWSEYFPTGKEVLRYLEHVTEEYKLEQYMKFHHELLAAKWDESTSHWNMIVRNPQGKEQTYQCNAIISASGLFSTPNKFPDINGLTSFQGPILHTSQWDQTIDYHNKRVALIGTGSTGTQLAPALAHDAQRLTIFQRTANWVTPLTGFKDLITDETHWLHDNMPYYWHWYCYGAFFKTLDLGLVSYHDEAWKAGGGMINRRNDGARQAMIDFIHEKLGDRPDLVAKVTPKNSPYVRRMVIDNGFYDTVRLENVDLVTDEIDSITESGILTKDKKYREFDMVILSSGFKVNRYLFPINYEGTEGMTLEKAWEKDGARSYLGMAMPNYPNFFMLYGPNHQPRGSSLPSFSELWSRYAVSAIVGMIERGIKSMEIKKEEFDDYNAKLDLETDKFIWGLEGAGYFINKQGRQQVNMPWSNADYYPMIQRVDFEKFNLR